MVLGHFDREGEAGITGPGSTPLSASVTRSIRTTHAILRKTARASALVPGAAEDAWTDEELDAKDENRRPRRMKARELRLVGSIDIILSAGERDGTGDSQQLGEMQPWNDFWDE